MNDWKRAVVRVWQGNPHRGGKYKGSAFLFAPGRLLTAKHVIQGVPEKDIYLTGSAWGGVRKVADTLPHPHRDVAVLSLAGSEPDAMHIPLSDATETLLELDKRTHVHNLSKPPRRKRRRRKT